MLEYYGGASTDISDLNFVYFCCWDRSTGGVRDSTICRRAAPTARRPCPPELQGASWRGGARRWGGRLMGYKGRVIGSGELRCMGINSKQINTSKYLIIAFSI